MAKNEKESKAKKNRYFKDMKAELKKVIWPTRKQLANNTVAVIVFALIIAVIVFVLDLCFDSINKYGITAAQQKIKSSYQSSEQKEENTAGEENQAESEDETNTVESEEDIENATNITVETENNEENNEESQE